jgi:dihydrolipoamide dehydrogenase
MLQIETARGVEELRFEQAVIATGSSPAPLADFPFDGKRIIGSRAALSLEEIPERLVVIGGGYVGLELGEVYAKLGSEVSVVEYMDALVPQIDDEVAAALMKRLKQLGIKLYLGHKAESLAGDESMNVTIVDTSGSKSNLEADVVLVSTGRKPNSHGIGIEGLGVSTDASGFIQVNERMETTVAGLYAIGDVVGGPLLAHKAYREAKIVAQVIAGEPMAFDNIAIPAVVYTDPEVAWVGMTEREATSAGIDVVTGAFPLRASGRALTLNAPEGLVKTIADKNTRRILGVLAVGKGVSEIISKGALALEMGALLDDIAGSIDPHPTMSEALLESVEAALGKAIHQLNR